MATAARSAWTLSRGARGMAELNPARGARGGAELVARAGAERVVVRSFNWWSVGLWPQRFLGALFP